MKIGIEAERANYAHPTGVEHYAKQMILNFAKLNAEKEGLEFILYLRSEPAQWLRELPANFKIKVMPFPIFWTQIRISLEMILHPVDALFIMAAALPILHPKNTYVTIHDVAWKFFPESFGKFNRYFLPVSTWYACKFAKKIIAVSNATKNDLLKLYDVPQDRIVVVHHGFDFATENMSADSSDMEKIAKLPAKFILYLGTIQPRKNIIRLIEAFEKLKAEKYIQHSLVLVGGKGWLYEETMEKIENSKDVNYLGYVNDRFEFLKRADLLVQPALYEGFGMQILDAFYEEIPVAASNVSSLPEVGGEAAIYFDPTNTGSIADTIYRALSDDILRQKMKSAGKERLNEFTWVESARKTLNILKGKNV